MRMCVYGAGAMGTSLGAFLTRGGEGCDLITRNERHVFAMKSFGARIEMGKNAFSVPVSALLPEEMEERYDVIFLATKQRENREIARFLDPFLKADGALVTVQNGLPEEGLAEVLGADRIYGCTLGWGAEQKAPGCVSISSGELFLSVGAYGSGKRLREIETLLSASGIEVTTGELAEIRYGKLVVNAAFSTLSAISGLSFGELASKHKKLVLALMRETVAVAKAVGCKRLVQNGHDILKFARSPFAGLILPVAMKRHAAIRSGMLKDLEGGRRCDVDFVAGAVVREGREAGVPCPKLERAVSLVHDVENGLAEIAPESLWLLEE